MSSVINRNVFEGHFKPYCDKGEIPQPIRYQIQLMIEYVNNGVHPIKSISKEAISSIKEYTGVDVSILNIKDIQTPPQSEMFSSQSEEEVSNTNTIPFNPSDSTCCKYYSLSENLSSEYSYANKVSVPTCSHPKSPFGLYCIAGTEHFRCPHNQPDTDHYADVLDPDGKLKFKVTYQRTAMGIVNFYVVDDKDSLINKLSFYANDHSQVPKDEFAKELLDVLSDINSMTNVEDTKLSIEYPIKDQQQTFAVSYISTLIPEKV